jgi:hypothetical protein
MAALAVDIIIGTVGGLACGYIAQWAYSKLFSDKDNKAIVDMRGIDGYMSGQSGVYLPPALQAKFNEWKNTTMPAGKVFWRGGRPLVSGAQPALPNASLPAEDILGKWGELADSQNTETINGIKVPKKTNGVYDAKGPSDPIALMKEWAGSASLSAEEKAIAYARPGYASAGNPLLGIMALQLLNGVAVMLWYMLAGRYGRQSGLANAMFVMSLYILELDDFLALSHRVVAPLGGDPLRSGRGASAADLEYGYSYGLAPVGTSYYNPRNWNENRLVTA